ncbi:MAG: roadblock/LC7 domain-containing protein [Candidatus Thorarchaeota archaeon]
MEREQVDTQSESEQPERKPTHESSEKPKKVRKTQVKKETSGPVSGLIHTATEPLEKPKKARKPQGKKERLEQVSEQSLTTAVDNSQESAYEESIDEAQSNQTEISLDSENLAQLTPIDDNTDQVEENASPLDESGESQVVVGFDDSTPVESVIPPIQQIRNHLTDFEMRVPVWGLTVFTVDGYILAHRLFYDAMPENLEMVVSSMSAGMITISQDFIRLVASDSQFRQVLIDADNDSDNVSFSVLLKQVAENVMLTCIFPNTAKLGLVSFEIENLSNDIKEVVKLWDVKLHEASVT